MGYAYHARICCWRPPQSEGGREGKQQGGFRGGAGGRGEGNQDKDRGRSSNGRTLVSSAHAGDASCSTQVMQVVARR